MNTLFEQVVPLPVLGLVVFALLTLGTVFFIPRQRAREFTMLTTGRVLGFAAVASVIVTGAAMIGAPDAAVSYLFVLAPAAALIYLLAVTTLTDFSVHKIPTESAWLPAVIGVAAFVLTYLSGVGVDFTLERIFVLCVLAVLPVVAFLSLLFSGGGAADYRVSMAGFLATAWWVSPATLMLGVAAFVVFTLVGRFGFSTPNDSGRRMTPAGPAYVSLFAVMAVASVMIRV